MDGGGGVAAHGQRRNIGERGLEVGHDVVGGGAPLTLKGPGGGCLAMT